MHLFRSLSRHRSAQPDAEKRMLGKVPITYDPDLCFIGSNRGGWVASFQAELTGCTFLSFGAGDNISFDVEMASMFGANGVLIDPTPLSKSHFDRVLERTGLDRKRPYRPTESQYVDCYDLSRIRSGQLRLIEKAIWTSDGTLDFHAPADDSTVSYSIDKKHSSSLVEKIQVETISPYSLAKEVKSSEVYLMKLDIEGAEIEVIGGLLASFPSVRQLLVEFDAEKLVRADRVEKLRETIETIEQSGFTARHREGRNFLFTRFN